MSTAKAPAAPSDRICEKNDKFQIIPIYKIKKDDTNLRRQMETYFINMLMPDLNH